MWHGTGRWFSLDTPLSSTNKTDCHDITEICLKVSLNTINLATNHIHAFVKFVSRLQFSPQRVILVEMCFNQVGNSTLIYILDLSLCRIHKFLLTPFFQHLGFSFIAEDLKKKKLIFICHFFFQTKYPSAKIKSNTIYYSFLYKWHCIIN